MVATLRVFQNKSSLTGLEFSDRTLVRKTQPENFLQVELESPLATLLSFWSRVAPLFTEKFFNIKSQREGMD